ncbi:MAG TPA: hypothetical protein VID50_00265 [Candidatus Eisenbacteria bacterium]
MTRTTQQALAAGIAALFLVCGAGAASAKEYPKCQLSHPGRADRAKRLLADGDTEVCKSIAKHVVKYAIAKYGLEGVVTNEAEIKEARKEMYDFLKWKLGNPSAVAAQWVSAGYKHFDKAYSDEAGAAALGSDLPGPGAELKLPRELSAWLKAKVDSVGMSSEGEASLCDQLTGGGEGPASGPAGAPGGEGEDDAGSALLGVGCELTLSAVKEALKLAIDRIGISLSTGTHWDISNRSVELMAYARLHPLAKRGLVQATKVKGATATATKRGVPTRLGR